MRGICTRRGIEVVVERLAVAVAVDLDLAFDLDLDLPPHREAEWRFCGVGRPAWMPGEPCWAKDGPSRRAHGAGPERGAPERSEGRTQGQGLFAYFCGCLTKVSRRKGGTRRKF